MKMFDKIKDVVKKRKLLVVILLVFFAANIFTIISTFTEKTSSTIWDGKIATKFKNGSGSAVDPYIIDNGNELAYFFTLINSEDSSEYSNKFYRITNNIDLNGYDFSFAVYNKTFSGVLDGGGYTISNFTIDKYYYDEEGKTANISMFDSLYSANIRNINISDFSISVDGNKIVPEVKEEETEKTAGTINDYKVTLVNDEEGTENTNNETTTGNETTTNTEVGNNENPTTNETPAEEPKEEPKEEPTNPTPAEPEVKEEVTPEVKEEEKKEEPEKTEEEVPTETTDEVKEEETKEDEVVEDIIEKITISLFRDVKQSTIENISVNDFEISYKGDEEKVESSLFVLYDVENNTIENINMNGESNLKDTYVLIGDYKDAKIKNIIYTTKNLRFAKNCPMETIDSIYRYNVEDGKLTFYENYSTKAIIEALSDNSTLRWKLSNNKFRIVNAGSDGSKLKATRARKSAPSAHASGTDGTTVYVNDYEADYNYYMGLNYTYSSNGRIPTATDKGIYGDNNLVYVQINYHGSDINGQYTGQLSQNENYSNFVYYKVYDVQNGYVNIDLIDNPFSRRPNNRTFNGWITNYEGAEITIDTDVYVRRMKVPVTMNGSTPENMVIDVYAVWNEGVIHNYQSNWSTTFSYLESDGFHAISSVTVNYGSVTGYYTRTTVNAGSYYGNGQYDDNGNLLTGTCPRRPGNPPCTVYVHPTGAYVQGTTYYDLVNGTMTPITVPQITTYNSEVPVGNSIAGYFRRVNIPNGGSLNGYYNSSGTLLTSGTASSGNNYYELIQYYDENDDPEVVVQNTIYYYKTTRDTNIVVMTGNVTGTWGSSQNKPFTFTAINGNNSYINNTQFSVQGATLTCYNDTRIENMRIYSYVSLQNNGNSPTTTGAHIIGNNQNLKIGRHANSTATNRVSFRFVTGSTTNGTGSSSNITNYLMIVESGVINNIGVTTYANSTSSNYYVHAKAVYGSDFARVTEEDPETSSELTVRYIAAGSWAGNVRASGITDVALDQTVKSGRFGINKYDCYAGIYVGGLNSGSHYATRKITIEGGYIYNVLGGPLSREDYKAYVDTLIYMKGGTVDIIVGGAGRTATYCSKVIQVTGGNVRYAVFGGSNGVEGNDSDQKGTVDGDTMVYIGGDALIGTTSLVANNAIESESQVEAGSVFGIGNGRSGYNAIGTVNNSNVIIAGDAHVLRNVYGGGNYGATGRNGQNQTYQTTIKIVGGTIDGSVYGGGNNNGAGCLRETSGGGGWGQSQTVTGPNTVNIEIEMTAGTVSGSVYGGSRTKGTVYGSTEVNIIGGTITTDVYGGGEGGYTNTNNPGTFVDGNVDITIGDSNGGPRISGSVYGGSAYGTVNATSTGAAYDSNKHVNVTVNNGNVVNSVFGGAKGSSTFTPYVKGDITVDINGGTITNVFGGFDEAGQPVGTDNVYIDGGTVTNVYGGGNKTSLTTTHVYMRGGNVTTMYGGSNQAGTVSNTYVTVSGGTTGTIYGGNNQGGTCTTTHVNVSSGTISNIYGGGNLVGTTTTNIEVTGNTGTITNIFGGGNSAGATTTNVELDGSTAKATNVYGGSNTTGNVTNSYVTLTNGEITNMYGGNNAGGETATTHVTIDGGKATIVYGGGDSAISGVTNVVVNDTSQAINTIYGGGNAAACTTTNVTINKTTGTFTNVFGGGNSAGATTTNVTTTAANVNITNIYGGSNTTGDVTTSNVKIQNGTVTTIYGGNNAGGETTNPHVVVTTGTIGTIYGGGNSADSGDTSVIVHNGTVGTIYGGGNLADSGDTNVLINNGAITHVYGGGNAADVEDASVTIKNATGTITNVFGGGNSAGATSTTVLIGEANGPAITVTNVFGGSNSSGDVGESHVTVTGTTITNLYGGNNAGGETDDANLTVNNATVTNIYGGGNEAVSGSAEVVINGGSSTNVFGGGNAAGVTGNTNLTLIGGSVPGNIYGGGNEGEVGGNTNVLIQNATIGGSAYAGGNGSTAVVHGNTTITVSGTTTVGSASCANPSTCSVFGGGNAATTGNELTNNSTASVKITGATIYGNVYGGANTAKVYGSTDVNIGTDVPTGTNITRGNIDIKGTVFGGGEANASGSTTYDFSFISVTQGVIVNINGQGYNNFDIHGSIFGSGNASSSEGASYIYIKNYGTKANPKYNISLQRADLVEMNNSAIVLAGATDRTNDWADVLFSLSRVTELDLKNNSVIFMENGANLLNEFKSLDADGDPAEVEIGDNGIVSRTADNRLYIFAGKHLDIAKDQNATDMGPVTGMTFFGMFKYNNDDTVNTGIYEDVTDGGDVEWAKVFDNVTSYVAGLHKTNHDIEVDGFYTTFAVEETGKYDVNYIEPTPPTGPLYMWIIGAGVIEYELDLTASRYSTLGTSELSLRDFTNPNTTFSILGFDYSELNAGVSLINKTDIPKIASNGTNADNVMGVSIETSNTGWLNNGQTSFVTTDPDNPAIGTQSYVKGNTVGAPTLLVYLHHSKNIATAGSMGTVRIQLMSVRQINALDKETKRLIITLNLSRVLIDSNTYEGAMTPGRKYELFASTTTNISSTSAISAYYSFFKTGTEIYKTGYHRMLVSTFVFPLNTKITMIDLSRNTPEYYYKVVDATELARAQAEYQNVGEVSYNISTFEAMGAENSGVYYDDAAMNAIYYNSSQEYANEEFIFIVDFGDTTITTDQLQNKLLLEMRNSSDATIYSVFAPQHDNLTYNIYANKDAIIEMDGSISANKIYNGDEFTADITIDYTQGSIGSTVIYDTHYFDSKLGIKISLLNSDGEVVTGTTLLGLYYVIDEVRYDPNIDGTTRIKIADKVDDAEKWIMINTGTSAIASGTYTLRVESFGSPDGIYYGLESSDHVDFEIEIVNEIYGLNVETTAEEMSINKDTGANENGSNSISYTVKYNSGLNDPNIRFKLYRRNYNTIDDTTYSLVDAQDYFTDELVSTSNENEYLINDDPDDEFEVEFETGENLMSGTYKMQFILYDENAIIGSVDKYFIIK